MELVAEWLQYVQNVDFAQGDAESRAAATAAWERNPDRCQIVTWNYSTHEFRWQCSRGSTAEVFGRKVCAQHREMVMRDYGRRERRD